MEWQYWTPAFDGCAPVGVSVKNYEIHSSHVNDENTWSNLGYTQPWWCVGQKYRFRPRSADVTPQHYTDLRAVLDAAYEQSAHGKGLERHGSGGKPWTEQPIFTIAGQVGDGFNAGQAIKKIQEAQQMAARGEHSKAMHEVLGAIVYAASLHVLWSKEVNNEEK